MPYASHQGVLFPTSSTIKGGNYSSTECLSGLEKPGPVFSDSSSPPGWCPPCRVDPEELAQAAPQLPPPEQPLLHQPSGHLGGHLKAQTTFYNPSGSPVSCPPHFSILPEAMNCICSCRNFCHQTETAIPFLSLTGA